MEPKWCGDRVFKVSRNEGEDTTLVFHIDFISKLEINHNFGENPIVTIEFYASKIMEESGSENLQDSPKLKGRKLLLLGGNHEKMSKL